MKKLFLLLSAVGLIFTACEDSDGIEEGNGASPFIPKITISPQNLIFSCHGGTQKVYISANFQYEVNENASWLTVEQTGDGLQVVAEISQNQTERSAYILITNSKYNISETIEVLQESNIPKIKLAEQNVEVDFEPDQYSVGVSSPYSWDATSKNDWIVIDTTTGIAGDEELKFTTKRNEEEQERKGTIVLKNSDYNLVAELYITQVKFAPEISIDTESLNFTCDGGTQEIAISANFEYEWTEDTNWLSVKKIEKGLAITAEALDTATTRSACITISNEQYGVSRVVPVSQDAATMESGRVIYYTSSDGRVVTPTGYFNANIVSNTYKNGQGVIIFNGIVTSIEDYAFYDCTSLTSVTIPDSVTSIGSGAFEDCTSLTSVTIGNGVTSIGEYAFYDCSSLTSVHISDLSAWCQINFASSVANPLYYAHNLYLNRTLVEDLVIPNSVILIGNYAFSGCTSLTSVTIPDSVFSIGNGAFSDCTSLTSVYCKRITPPTINMGCFANHPSRFKIYVPKASVHEYKNLSNWMYYSSYIVGYDFQ